MKPILISSSIALTIGFTFGWLFHSSSQQLNDIDLTKQTTSTNQSSQQNQNSEVHPKRNNRPSLEIKIPHPDRKPFIPVTNDTALDAKWHHFSSTLSLNEEQTKQITNLIEQNSPERTGATSPLEAVTKAGENLEKAILQTLDPDQQQAFKALQERSLLNHFNSKAMLFFSKELSDLDLSESQRQKAIETLVLEYQQKGETIPNSTRLLLDGSFLPQTGPAMSDYGIFIIKALGQSPPIEKLAEMRKEQMYQMVARFDGILTPAQIKIYEDKVRKSLEKLDIISPP